MTSVRQQGLSMLHDVSLWLKHALSRDVPLQEWRHQHTQASEALAFHAFAPSTASVRCTCTISRWANPSLSISWLQLMKSHGSQCCLCSGSARPGGCCAGEAAGAAVGCIPRAQGAGVDRAGDVDPVQSHLVVTFQQPRMYGSSETLFRDTTLHEVTRRHSAWHCCTG